jgi:nucleoside-diphosphate-sugar epimerase
VAADRPALKRVLVTGATGFLGRSVVARLREAGCVVTAHGRNQTPAGEHVRGDLADPRVAARLLYPWRWDAVVNLAGPVTSGSEDLRTGIAVVTEHERIALHVRRYAQNARIVHASSMTVYGMPERVDVDESHPTRPQHLYGLAKLVAEDILLVDPAVDAWVLRLPGLFSEQRTTGALYHFCKAARAGEPLRVTTPAPTVWNVLHVDDAADAIVRALNASGRGGAINVSYGEPVDLVSVARLIASHAGTGSPVETTVDHPPFHLVIARAKQLLGLQVPSLHDRLAKLYADYAAA